MVIGLSGKIKSGKSKVAEIIKEIYEENKLRCEIKSFAQPIYEIVSKMYDTDIETIKKQKRKNFPIYINTRQTSSGFKLSSYRDILQTIGTTARDYGDKDIWVNALFGTDCEKVVTDMTSNGVACWVVDDLRFPNEAERILSCNGKLIRINRSDAEESEHIVENSLNDWVDWDLTIENNYPTEKEFIKELELILREYLEGKIAKRGATDEGQSIKHS